MKKGEGTECLIQMCPLFWRLHCNELPVVSHPYDMTNISTASQMWLLGRLLPLMVGKLVRYALDVLSEPSKNSNYWRCIDSGTFGGRLPTAVYHPLPWLDDSKNTLLATFGGTNSPVIKTIIRSCNIIMTFVHRFGPLRHQWCMRFEEKNHSMKMMVGLNFKNVPKSVAVRHQYYMCLQLLSPPGCISNFLYKEDKVGKGKIISCGL